MWLIGATCKPGMPRAKWGRTKKRSVLHTHHDARARVTVARICRKGESFFFFFCFVTASARPAEPPPPPPLPPPPWLWLEGLGFFAGELPISEVAVVSWQSRCLSLRVPVEERSRKNSCQLQQLTTLPRRLLRRTKKNFVLGTV